LHNIFSDLKKEVLKSEKFKNFFDKILEIFDKNISDEGYSPDFELILQEDLCEIQEKFKIFKGIFRKIQVLKVELDFEFSHVFLILKYILRKSSIEYKISPQLICEKHDIFEFIQSFQKNKSTDNFFMNCSESEQNKLYEDILILEDQKSILETGFCFQIFGIKAKKFLNGDLKISFNKEIGEFEFS
jgi:hypothetical protein